MKRSHYILYVILCFASIILLAMNIYDLFTGGVVRWFDMILCPIVATVSFLRLKKKAQVEKNDDMSD